MATVGIVVPIGRYSPTLKRCLDSIACQTVDIKLAIFDASNDLRTVKVIQDYEHIVSFLHHGPDNGQAAAIKKGWSHLDADILTWLNDDDYFAPEALTNALDIFHDNKNIQAVFGPSGVVDLSGRYRGKHPAVNPQELERIFYSCVISQPSCLVRRSAVVSIGGVRPELNYTMDWDLWARLYAKYPNGFFYDPHLLSMVLFSRNTKTAQISLGRLSEIYRIPARYIGFLRGIKTVLAFTKQTLFNYWFIPFKASKTYYPSIDGRYRLWHFDESGIQSVLLCFHEEMDMVPHAVSVSCEKIEFKIKPTTQNKQLLLLLPVPVKLGVMIDITFLSSRQNQNLVSIELLK